MPVPELAPDQRREALAKALEVRRTRAELKQMLKSGEVGIGEVLAQASSAEALANMRVAEVIGAMPTFGPARARRLMEELQIAPSRRLRGLGPRQRQALLDAFGSGA